MALLRWLRLDRFFSSARPTRVPRPLVDPSLGRVVGPPTSSNRASSAHLRWEFAGSPGGGPPLQEVSVDLTIVDPPTVPALYFWALQASFRQGRARLGAGHMGLQHHPRHPDNGAVNWGGYHEGGGELAGSTSALPSTLDNVNSRDFVWRAATPYRYTIRRSPDRGWRATITDRSTGVETVIRDLWVDADHLDTVIVWSEVFADCDAPSVRVEWSNPAAVTMSGATIAPVAMTTSYQSFADGGCSNTTAEPLPDGSGVAQVTNRARSVPAGTTIGLRPAR